MSQWQSAICQISRDSLFEKKIARVVIPRFVQFLSVFLHSRMFNLKNKKTDVTTDFYPSMVLFSLHRCDFDELIPVSDVNGSGSHFDLSGCFWRSRRAVFFWDVGRIHGERAQNDWVGSAEGIVHGLRSKCSKEINQDRHKEEQKLTSGTEWRKHNGVRVLSTKWRRSNCTMFCQQSKAWAHNTRYGVSLSNSILNEGTSTAAIWFHRHHSSQLCVQWWSSGSMYCRILCTASLCERQLEFSCKVLVAFANIVIIHNCTCHRGFFYQGGKPFWPAQTWLLLGLLCFSTSTICQIITLIFSMWKA